MRVIGITGGVGSGKSTVLGLLRKLCKCDVIMADDVAKELMQPGETVFNEVVDYFGKVILDNQGEIDRNILAKIIFDDDNSRLKLNSIVHPKTKSKIIAIIDSHKINNDVDFVFVEAALFFEDNYDKFVDEVWYIFVDEETRRNRLKESRGYSDEKITNIINSQMSVEEFTKRSKCIINNSTTLEKLEKELRDFLL